MTTDFYDRLAPYYDLLFENWDASIDRQGAQLNTLIRAEWPGAQRILDAAAGIGTQSLGLAALGYRVSASDLSPHVLARAAAEAAKRGLQIGTAVADLRRLSQVHQPHDVVLVCDNALPHLLTDDDIRLALRECLTCTTPGGGCLLSMRDYPDRPGTGSEFHPYGLRWRDGRRYVLFQVWTWDGPCYDLSLYIVTDSGGGAVTAEVLRTRYYAIHLTRMLALMREAGFHNVREVRDAFYQPVLIGSRPPMA